MRVASRSARVGVNRLRETDGTRDNGRKHASGPLSSASRPLGQRLGQRSGQRRQGPRFGAWGA
eukprot:2686845-Prymnesium_polylepis.1